MEHADEAANFGTTLRHYRTSRHWRQEDVADALKAEMPGSTWTPQAVGYWERENKMPDPYIVHRLDAILEADGYLSRFAGSDTNYLSQVVTRLDELEQRQTALERSLEARHRRQLATIRELRSALAALQGDGSAPPAPRS